MPARAGPPGGFRGSEKTLYFAGCRRHGGFRGLEKRVFFIGFWLPAESEGAKTLHFHRFWASKRFSTSGRSTGERYPCVFIGIGLPGGIRETAPPRLGLPAGPGGSENFVTGFGHSGGRESEKTYFHRFWASRRIPGKRKPCISIGFRSPGGLMGNEKPLYFHKFWASRRAPGEQNPCVFKGMAPPNCRAAGGVPEHSFGKFWGLIAQEAPL